jgi:hypothetical protein
VINDCGTRDSILLLSQMIPFTGMAGRVGFRGALGIRLRNRFFAFGHSDYFVQPGFMERWWIPLLTRDEEAEPHDERDPSGWGAPKEWLLSYLEPIKLATYLTLTIAASSWAYRTTQEAELARRNAVLQRALSRVDTAFGSQDHARAALVALAAYDMNGHDNLRQDALIEGKLRDVLSVPAFSQIVVTGSGPAATSVAVSSDERLLVAGWEDGSLSCWNLEHGLSEPQSHVLGNSRLNALKFRASSHDLVAGADDGSVWNVAVSSNCAVMPRPMKPCPQSVHHVGFGPGGGLVAGAESVVCSWDDASAEPQVIRRGTGVLVVASDNEGHWLATSGGNSIELRRAQDSALEQPAKVEIPENERVTALAFAPDSQSLAVASWFTAVTGDQSSIVRRGRVRLFSPGLLQKRPSLLPNECTGQILSLTFSGNEWIVGGCADSSIRVWKLDDGRSESFAGHARGAVSLAGTRQAGRFVSAGGQDRTVRLWQIEPTVAPLVLKTEKIPVGLAFAGSQGQKLAAAVQSKPVLSPR